MAPSKPRDFTVPYVLSDVTLIVDGTKLYVSKAFLSTISPFFCNMFMKDFAESKQNEIPLIGPPDTGLKLNEFVDLLKVVHPPYEKIKVSKIDSLLYLAHYFDIDFVFRAVDQFLRYEDKDQAIISFNKRVVLIDRYGDKMPETKSQVWSELKDVNQALVVQRSAEYAILSDEMKINFFKFL